MQGFSMRPEAEPVAQTSRPVAYYLQEPLKKWLEQCIEREIFKEVPEEEQVAWCSPLVVQPKPKFCGKAKEDLEPHTIRASVDLMDIQPVHGKTEDNPRDPSRRLHVQIP